METLTREKKIIATTNIMAFAGAFGGVAYAIKSKKCLICTGILLAVGGIVGGVAGKEVGKAIFKA